MANKEEKEAAKAFQPENEEYRLNNEGYVGVDPIYQNSASVHQRPFEAAEGTTARLVQDTLVEGQRALEDANIANGDKIAQRGLGVPASPVPVEKTAVLPSADRTPADEDEDKKLAKELSKSNKQLAEKQEEERKAVAAEREADEQRIAQIRDTIVGTNAAQTAVAEGRAQGQTEASAEGQSESDGPTREELYERAQELDIEGRSDMNKDELAQAVEAAEAKNNEQGGGAKP